MKLNWSPRLTHYLVGTGLFRDEPFSLVDVGCSGGLPQEWRQNFGDQLQAIGFDPLISEIERLNATEKNPRVEYASMRLGCRAASPATPAGASINAATFDSTSYSRCTTEYVIRLRQSNYTTTYFDQTHQGRTLPEGEMMELDEYLRAHPRAIDFLKIDTDGHDLDVLRGSRELLARDVLGAAVEVLVQGTLHPGTNHLIHVEQYLHNLGYSLFAIQPRLHSRAALPKMFRWNQPADTHEGQAHWADTLFLRDVCLPDYEARRGLRLSPQKLLKLCSIHEIHTLEDCAAEILLHFRDRLQPLVDVEHCLNLLTPPLPDGRQVTYREYIDFFHRNIEAFYSGK